MIRLENISFAFSKKSKPFFKDLSIEFVSGTLHFITGKNGVGKSTLFRLLQGAVCPQELMTGVIDIDAKRYDCADQNVRARLTQKISLVQQNVSLMLADQFSFEENLRLACMPTHPGLTLLPKAKQFHELIGRFGIDITKLVGQLSGGQRQILAIMMALQKNCSVLLLDEPTAALDEKNADLVMQFLKEIAFVTNLTVLIICHDADLVDRYAKQYCYEVTVGRVLSRKIIGLVEEKMPA